MMLEMKFDYNPPAGLRDIHVLKCEQAGGRTDGRTPARVPSYKLPGAFGFGEKKCSKSVYV